MSRIIDKIIFITALGSPPPPLSLSDDLHANQRDIERGVGSSAVLGAHVHPDLSLDRKATRGKKNVQIDSIRSSVN
ncbi:hypothetical protein CDD81_7944 [Ophiocordyceps australis]|uniref:Uncharacterized protein n=1 Tax=Ophiocordyceps australis TaxID=1399860 RepID=A0A2C5Y2Z1_9HYPO|nr:hypothetical protein CDD81_7944 [Ophiocordyceps australis]